MDGPWFVAPGEAVCYCGAGGGVHATCWGADVNDADVELLLCDQHVSHEIEVGVGWLTLLAGNSRSGLPAEVVIMYAS